MLMLVLLMLLGGGGGDGDGGVALVDSTLVGTWACDCVSWSVGCAVASVDGVPACARAGTPVSATLVKFWSC